MKYIYGLKGRTHFDEREDDNSSEERKLLEATQLETALAKALGKSPLNIRYFATRFLAELLVGRNLTKEERQRLGSKIGNSFPRDRKNGGYVVWADLPLDDNVRAGEELLKIIERSHLTFRGEM